MIFRPQKATFFLYRFFYDKINYYSNLLTLMANYYDNGIFD